MSSGIGPFAVKGLIVTALVVTASFLVIDRLDSTLEERIRPAMGAIHGGREFWAKFERELERLADPKNDIPAEKKAKLLAQVRAIADRWRPFVVEVVSVADQTKVTADQKP